MTFETPALLLGLLAVAAPIAVHLINRRRATRVKFPALDFLARSNRRVARRLKLKQWALLASRIAFFVLIPLAMARPSAGCGGEEEQTGNGRLPASVVFVLDDSGSMSAPVRREDDRYAAAVAAIDAALRDLRPWDQAALVVASSEPELLVGELTDDRQAVARALRDYTPRFATSDLRAAFAAAGDIHAESRLPVRRTVLVTDRGAAGWPDTADAAPVDGIGRLSVLDVSDGDAANVAVETLSYERAPSGGEGEYAINATIRAWGGDDRQVTATLYVDGEAVGSAPVAVSPGVATSVGFTHTLGAAGAYEASVAIDGDTGPRIDDRRTVPVQPDRAVRTLVVDGDPRAVALNDEVYFLERALDVVIDERREIEPTVIAPDALGGTDLAGFDVVVLANVGALGVPVVERLQAFVEAGGGLLFTAGDNVDPDRWNSLFRPLLPKPVRSVKVLAEPGAADAEIMATRMAEIDASHPAVGMLGRRGGESARAALVYRYLLLEPSPDSDAEVVINYGDGGPALLERAVGRGRVMLWTTSVDLDWADVALTTAYVPMVRRLVEYLARRSGAAADQAELGARVVLPVAALGPERVSVETPSGERVVLDGDGEVSLVPREPGVHRVSITVAGEDLPVPELDFAANAAASEFDPATVAPELVDAVVARAAESQTDEVGGAAPAGRSLWPWLLFFGLVALYAESLLAVRRRFWVRLRRAIRRDGHEAAL